MRPKRPGTAICSSCAVDVEVMRGAKCLGRISASSSRPCRMKSTRCSVTWHAEQMKLWCSKPRTAIVLSGTTFVRIKSAPHAVQRIATTTTRPPPRSVAYRRGSRSIAVICYAVDNARIIVLGRGGMGHACAANGTSPSLGARKAKPRSRPAYS